MKIPEKGLSHDEIMQKLQDFRSGDMNTRNGRTWAYIYDPGDKAEEICQKAYMMYLTESALDPTVYPSVMRMENELVAMAKGHVGAGDEAVGNFTSGGTESIILAVKTARDWARANRPEIKEPEMILPVTGHAAFHKAAQYLCVKPVIVDIDRGTFKADPKLMEEAITDNTILLVASAPSYAHGVVDPIPAIGKLALEKEILFHVDACVGGFLLYYFRKLGATVTNYGFDVPGVTSLSMDLHKYGFTAKGASIVLYRDMALREHQIFSCSGWTGYSVINPTIQSSKTGGPVAAAWAVMSFLGEEGYLKLASAMYEGTRKLVEGVGRIPEIYVMGEPDMSLVAVTSDTVNVFEIADEMKTLDWYIQPQLGQDGMKENFHFTVTPSCARWVDDLLPDLATATERAGAKEPKGLAATIQETFSAIDPAEMTDEMFANMLGMAGIHGVGLPEKMAEINEILNALPPSITDRLLTKFFNELNQYRDEEKG